MAYSLSLIIDSFLIFNTITTTPTLDLNYLQYIIIKIVFNMFTFAEYLVLDYCAELLPRVLKVYRLRGSFVNVDLTSNPPLAPFALTKMSSAHIWSLVFFFCIFYVMTIFSLAASTTPLVSSFTDHKFKNTINYIHINAWSMYKFVSTPILVIFLITLSWISVTVNVWFGQIAMSSMQRNITLLCVSSFSLVYYIYTTNIIFNTKDIYDFIIALFNTFVWTFLLFYSNNFFTVVFFIEILTGLTTLLLITSAFSSTYNYQIWNFSKSLYFNAILPKNTLDTLIFFFWMSLVSSLFLFIFIIFFYTHLFTFEFSLIEVITSHVLHTATFKHFLAITSVSTILIIIVFLKCGLVPLYVWKPIVFKGMTLHVIFFYICFYYYFLLMFFIYLFIVYCHDILWESKVITFILVSFLLIGVVTLTFILTESYYFKSFLAMSSILNTLLIFLGLASLSLSSYFFIL